MKREAKIMLHIITDPILNMVRATVADQYEEKFLSGTFHLTKVKTSIVMMVKVPAAITHL